MALELFDLPTCHVLLEIENYQFPGHTDRLDANWLQVRGRIEDPRGSWSFVDPCLTTQELLKLERWLGALDPGAPAIQSCYFTEPCLAFHFNPGPHPVLELVLSHEAAPPGPAPSNAWKACRCRCRCPPTGPRCCKPGSRD